MTGGQGVVEENAFSVSAAKAMFEAAKRPEVQKAAMAAAKNPFIRKAAISAAQDKDTRNQMMNVLASSNAGNKPKPPPKKWEETPPPPPPHKNTRTSSSNSNHSSSNTDPPPVPSNSYRSSFPKSTDPDSSSSYTRPATTTSKLNVNPSFIAELQGMHLKSTPGSSQTTDVVSSVNKPSRPPPPRSSKSTYNLPKPVNSVDSRSTTEPHAIVKYPFNGSQHDELSCDVGDVILLKREVDEQWIYGINSRTGQNGIVPLDFLDIRIPLAPSQPSSQSGNIGTALYDYTSTTPGDLQFRCNDRISLIEWVNSEWLSGELHGQKGIFPANFISCPTLHCLPYRAPTNIQSTSQSSAPITTMYAAFDYFSGVPEDLHLTAGDSVEILEYLGTDWIRGRSKGQEGLAPISFLTSVFSPKKSPTGLASIASIANVKTMATVIEDHETTDSSNLYCTKGARIIIVEDCGKYLYRAKLEEFKSLPSGLIPKRKVVLDD